MDKLFDLNGVDKFAVEDKDLSSFFVWKWLLFELQFNVLEMAAMTLIVYWSLGKGGRVLNDGATSLQMLLGKINFNFLVALGIGDDIA